MSVRLPSSFLILVFFGAASAPASAQRLTYRPVDKEEVVASPRLAYRPVDGDSVPAGSAGSAGAPAERAKLLQWALLDRFEYAAQRGSDGYAWDFSALLGGSRNRLWLGTSGDGGTWGDPDYAELNAFYSRHVGGNWDLNAGLRWDAVPHPDRFYATLGAQHDASYESGDSFWFGAFGYVSHEGELSARLAAYYNWKLVGPLFLQPSAEVDAWAQDVPELGVGRGLGYAEAGLRLRYELLAGKIAPYAGLSWSRDLGRTARFTREAGDDLEAKSLVLGVRSAF
jgi:copper resistance protein B